MMLFELSGGSAVADRQTATRQSRATRIPPLLSVIVPTRDEVDNVAPLLDALEQAAPGVPMEIIFVDDSDDGTAEAVAEHGARCLCEVGLIHRPPERRDDGLGGAVLEGLWVSRGAWVCVMDGDLQHPPALIADLLAEADRTNADVVVASRRAPHGDADSLPALRSGISRTFTAMSRRLFGKRLDGVSDPMSGFFLVRRSALDLEQLDPHGFKILLDILIRTPGLKVAEVPFHFGERHAGTSKASTREGLRFLRLLWRLRIGGAVRHFAKFGLVGLTGLAVNTIVLAALTEGLGIYYLASAVVASQVSTLWLFCLTDLWVFRDRRAQRGMWHRLALYALMNNAALLLRSPLLVLLTSVAGINYLVSNVLSLAFMTVVRYGVADVWIWADDPLGHKAATATHDYDIHGLLSVRSEVALPELEGFRAKRPLSRPNIDVRLGAPSSDGDGNGNGNGHSRRIRYRDGLPGLGFGVEISMGSQVQVTASPALRFSPHVLYTNVVEPILRWKFVEKGYALVHGACLADGEGRALLITARTDTGKTTTTLKALDNQDSPWSFVSDDLTLVAADGRVLNYPKPLTISRHTVKAVKQAVLSRRERAGLLVQSKVHSRSGRRFAMGIAHAHLPAATINMVVQALIPPPKYFVERLVPGVARARQARLGGMVVIQRDGDGATVMGAEEALETLLTNCADAYGFPPYAQIEGFLHGGNGRDLRADERAIIAAALAGVRTTLLQSRTMDWWRVLPSVADGVS
jgi:dolichol-phosphate mannosyltransferase